MSFDTNWDVEKYKTEHESEEQWQLRRRFMTTHQDKFPEERLVCLTQVFSNIEFLGCRYPLETMQLVEQLSEGVVEDYREKKYNKLLRIFVKASDAACAKVKGLKRRASEDSEPVNSPPKIYKRPKNSEAPERPPESSVKLVSAGPDSSESTHFSCSPSTSKKCNGSVPKRIEFVTGDETSEILGNNVEDKNYAENKINGSEHESLGMPSKNSDSENIKTEVKKLCEPEDNAATDVFVENCIEHTKKIDTKKFGKLILVDVDDSNGPSTILHNSCTLCGIPIRIEYDSIEGNMLCKVYVNEQLVVCVFDAVKEVAKNVAVYCALEKLRDICYSLTVKKLRVFEDHVVDMETINSITCEEELRAPVARIMSLATPLPEDNVGSKLMRSMGWTGGGLGKAEQGIQEPVSVSFKLNRSGLGNKQGKLVSKEQKFSMNEGVFKSKVKNYLTQYLRKDVTFNLNFPHAEFFLPELNTIYHLAKSLGLQCSSNRNRHDRQLIISKQETIELIVARMLHLGIYSDEYSELKEPRNRKLLDNFEPETLRASNFPQLCHNKSYSELSAISEITNELVGVLSKMKTPEGKKMKRPEVKKLKGPKVKEAKVKSYTTYFKRNKKKNIYHLEAIAVGPYGHFFLIDHVNSHDSPWSILNFSAVQNGIPMRIDKLKVQKSWSCKLFVNGHLLTSCCEKSETEAHEKAVIDAYEKLKQICYILKVKSSFMPEDSVLEENESFEKNVTSERNLNNSLDKPGEKVDNRLMQAMEQTGGGLGKEKQEIEEPTCVAQRVFRSSIDVAPYLKHSKKKGKKKGLGAFRKSMLPILEKYAKDGSSHSIIFSSDFDKPERAVLHRMSHQLGLVSKSYGKESNRSLVVSKMINYCQIVEEMLRTGEYSTPLYELIKPPVSYSANFENLLATNSTNLDKEMKESSVCQPAKEKSLKVENIPFENDDSSVGKNSDLNVVKKDIDKLPSQRQIDNNKNAQPYGPLVLLENESCWQPLHIIEKSANACHIPFKMDYCKMKGGTMCRVFVNNIMVASNFDCGKKRARDMSLNLGLKELQNVCYTLKSEMTNDRGCLKVTKILKKPNSLESCDTSRDSEIVCNSKQLNWLSLGLNNREKFTEEKFISGIHDFLRKYSSEILPYDVVVPPDFTTEELAKIQKIASSLGLKIAKRHFAQKDFLILSKKLSILQFSQAFMRKEENESSNSLDETNAAVICCE